MSKKRTQILTAWEYKLTPVKDIEVTTITTHRHGQSHHGYTLGTAVKHCSERRTMVAVIHNGAPQGKPFKPQLQANRGVRGTAHQGKRRSRHKQT